MLLKIFSELDAAVRALNQEAFAESSLEVPRFYIKVLGQIALLEANIGLPLISTVDVDAFANFRWIAKKAFIDILAKHGKYYDELSSEIWMPSETEYRPIFSGDTFDGYIAEPEYVLLSKALKAPAKNKNLLRDYLARSPSPKFFELGKKYNLDLRSLV